MLARDLMTKNPTIIKQNTKIEDIIETMDKKGIDMIPEIGEETNGKIVGVVSKLNTLTEKMNERFVTIERKSSTYTTS
jgi:CBS domain-containing protein